RRRPAVRRPAAVPGARRAALPARAGPGRARGPAGGRSRPRGRPNAPLPASPRRRGTASAEGGDPVTALAVRLERMRWFHLDQVLAIEEDLFGAERWTPSMFWNELAHGHHYLVAMRDAEVVGYAG